MVTMPCEWFEVPENNPGTLVSRLTSDAADLNKLTSTVTGI